MRLPCALLQIRKAILQLKAEGHQVCRLHCMR
jgi:hypothetical protein